MPRGAGGRGRRMLRVDGGRGAGRPLLLGVVRIFGVVVFCCRHREVGTER